MKAFEPPLADHRGYDDIIAQIGALAPGYAPEWRFDPGALDAGSALASAMARLIYGSVSRFARSPVNHKTAFFSFQGVARRGARPASGAVVFSLISPNAGGVHVPKDFRLFSQPDAEGARLSYETQRGVYVSPARIVRLVYADPASDKLFLSGEDQNSIDTQECVSAVRHILTMRHEFFTLAHPGSRLLLSAQGGGAKRFLELLTDRESIECKAGGEVLCLEAGEGRLLLSGAHGAECMSLTPLDKRLLRLAAPERLFLELEADSVAPDALFARGEPREPSLPFAAFGEEFTVNDTMCVLCDRVLRQAGALVTLTFRIDFTEALLGDIPAVTLPSKLVVKKKNHLPPERQNITADDVVWEYFNGTGFAPLQTLEPSGGLFAGLDAGGALKPPGERRVRFVCPPDFVPLIVGASEGLCLRARLRSAAGIYRRPARMIVPHLSAVRFSYKYPAARAVTDFTLEEGCDTRSARELPNRMFEGLPESPPALYFQLDRPIGGGPLSMLLVLPEGACEGGRGQIVWQSFEKGGWRRLRVRDETNGLRDTGVVELDAHPDSAELFGMQGHWLRAVLPAGCHVRIDGAHINAAQVVQCESAECFSGDTQVGLLQLPGGNIISAQVSVNRAASGGSECWQALEDSAFTLDGARGQLIFRPALRLSAAGRTTRVRYRRGGGWAGNCPAGSLFTPALALGNLHSAVNPSPLWGGMEAETGEQAEMRAACELRHGGRPVTLEDFEDILSGMGFVRCLTGPEGGLTVVILPGDRDAPFAPVRKRVLEALAPLLPPELGAVRVRPPDLVYVSVTASLELAPCAAGTVEAEEALRALCEPARYGNARGLGHLPDTREIYETLLALDSVLSCRGLMVRCHDSAGRPSGPTPFALPLSGRITLEGILSNA